MKTSSMVVQCRYGLHARVAAKIVRISSEHDANVHIQCQGCTRANACSILDLMRLGVQEGDRVEAIVDGPDEEAVIEKLKEVFEGGGGI